MRLDFIPDEMVEKFYSKSQENYIAGEFFECDTEKGFMTFDVVPNCIFVHNVFGDGKYWETRAGEIAKSCGIKKVKTAMSIDVYDKLKSRYPEFKISGYLLEKEV